MERLLIEDAPFHVGRKVPDLELGVLHSACTARPGQPAPDVFYTITKYLIKVNDSHVEFLLVSRLAKESTRLHRLIGIGT